MLQTFESSKWLNFSSVSFSGESLKALNDINDLKALTPKATRDAR